MTVRNRSRKEIDRQEAEFAAIRAEMNRLGAAPPLGTITVGAHDHDGLTDWTLSCAHGYTEETTHYTAEPQAQLDKIIKTHRVNHAKNDVLCLCSPVEGMTVEP